jgi:phosphonate transport system substrate-binding protein
MVVMLKRLLQIAVAAGGTLLACACDAERDYRPVFVDKPAAPSALEYVLGVYPLHNPEHLFAVYGPIADYLTAHIPGTKFRLEASRSYANFEKKLYARSFQFALPNPYQTIRSLDHGYRVFGKIADEDFCGIILVRRDSGVEKVTDLKGKAVSYPAPTGVASKMLPEYYLHTHGLDVNRDIRNLYVGSHESSIMSVYRGVAVAGATRPGPWLLFQQQHPEEAGQLVEKWRTEALPNVGLVARDDVPQAVVDKAATLLFSLQTSEEGRKLLKRIPTSHFEAAKNDAYEPMRAFLRNFSAKIRPVEEQ